MLHPRIPVDAEEVSAFCERNRIRRLALFGSALRDDFGPNSDLDVLVEFEPRHTIGYRFITLQDDLSELFGRRVDLNTPQDLSRYFRDDVRRSAQILYDADWVRAA